VTFSIVGRGHDGTLGVAVASKFLAVGAAVPAAEAGVGALATQAYANLAYRPQGLALLRHGASAAETVAGLVAADPGRDQRLVGVVAAAGDGATYSGPACHDWAGGRTGDGYAVQGNILTGEDVVAAMERAWLAADPGAPLVDRLLDALAAGDAAGGDRRGRQSAAVYAVRAGGGYGGTADVVADLRADDHADPVGELRRLASLHELYFGKPDPATLLALDGDLAEEVTGLLDRAGHTAGHTAGPTAGHPARHTATTLDAALAAWAGIVNLEERLVPGKIDPLVLAHLREETGRDGGSSR
jgi:uncharacterized Ntn-hydrolase superfamily protein